MIIFYTIDKVKTLITSKKQQGKSIGFVPTMGALHNGHISLLNEAKQQTDYTVCSIFVNPTQFNNASDLTLYPKTPEKDIKLLEEAGCDMLYLPDVKDVYPEKDTRIFTFGLLDTLLEAAHRPGHFNGVAQVVSILLNGIQPSKAFFGSKDYQQVMVVKSLVEQLKLPVQIIECPIIREKDGLAMSSRNVRLSTEEREVASIIPKLMLLAREIAINKGVREAKAYIIKEVSKQPSMKLEYYEICDAVTLEPFEVISSHKRSIALIALFVGNVRLIDNLAIVETN